MSDELVAWLRARLDEDEAAAKMPAPGPWAADGPAREHRVHSVPTGVTVALGWKRDLDHIARHDPARVLREVEADRELIAAYEKACERDPDGTDPDFASGLYVAIKLRAKARGWTG